MVYEMRTELKYEVRRAKENEWEDAMALAWRTFMRFEACDYIQEGIDNFSNFISDNGLHRMFMIGEYHLWVAVADDKIIGMISLRSKCHVSLLFVDAAYHKQGIATALMETLWEYMREKDEYVCTVNASPYAVGFYHKLGFKDRAGEQEDEGIRYTPMKKLIW